MEPRCLVLGAGGFIGRNLCLALVQAGFSITGCGRHPAPPALSGLPWHTLDIDRLDDPDALLAGHTHLFDLIGAGLPSSSNDNPSQLVADSLPPRIRLLEACHRQRLRRVVFASSGGTVYGQGDATPFTETSPTDPISAYGIGKLAMEKYLALYWHLHRLDYRILRIANAYGPGQDPLREQGLVAAVLHRLRTGSMIPVWGNGAAIRDYVFIDDVIAAIMAVSFTDDAALRLCNVGSGIGRSVLSVIDDAARLLGRTPLLEHRPARSADVAVNILDSTRLRTRTGWRPRTDWPDGLAATAARWSAPSPAPPTTP